MKLILSILAFACSISAAAQIDETSIQISGVLGQRTFPGRPNYERLKKGDEAEKVWILAVSNGGKNEVFQLVKKRDARGISEVLRQSIGKRITVIGVKWPAHTGHHHTPYLITVETVVADK